MDVLADGEWERVLPRSRRYLQRKRKKHGFPKATDVTLGSDAFFPFSDNIERAFRVA